MMIPAAMTEREKSDFVMVAVIAAITKKRKIKQRESTVKILPLANAGEIRYSTLKTSDDRERFLKESNRSASDINPPKLERNGSIPSRPDWKSRNERKKTVKK